MSPNSLPWVLAALALILTVLYLFERWTTSRLKGELKSKSDDLAAAETRALESEKAAQEKVDAALSLHDGEIQRVNQQGREQLSKAQSLVDKEREELRLEAARMRAHYEAEVKKVQLETDAIVTATLNEIMTLRKYQTLKDAEAETRYQMSMALQEATSLRAEAETLIEAARVAVKEERTQALRRATDLRQQADQILDRATRSAARIVEDAHRNAEKIAGDAYTALRDKEKLEQAAAAIRNIINGYGDRYVVPTHGLIDDLGADYEHTEAGKMLLSAREQSKRMVEEGATAACDYAETDRREMAIRFVIDAFNGRVDSLLSEAEDENYGTLEQRIRDAFSIVNLNGQAFRNARILPAYLDARLAELKWTVTTFELRKKEREEQRRIKEQIREEEKVRREQERAIREAEEEKAKIQQAIAKAQSEAAQANFLDRAEFEQQLAVLKQKLTEAEAKGQRVKALAELTKQGNVYVISNVGSFGENTFKIGMTRRQEPMDRVWELSDASVPFDFDVHAMIGTLDAPALEYALHTAFDEFRINKVNYRKEFFRVSLDRIRSVIEERKLEVSFTMLAEAREYRETLALEKMSPTEREKFERPPGSDLS